MRALYARARNHRFLILLVALLAMGIAQPLGPDLLATSLLADVLLSLVLVAVVLIVFERQHERWAALALATPTILARWGVFWTGAEHRFALGVAHHVLVVCFLGFAIFAILRGIFEEETVNSDHLLGTVCGYLLAGVAWGNAFIVVDMFDPGSFQIAAEIVARLGDAHTRGMYFNYFSLSTLTSAGFGDITPLGPYATTLTWLEAAFGQFYIAVVVAQLVGLRLAQAVMR